MPDCPHQRKDGTETDARKRLYINDLAGSQLKGVQEMAL